MYVIFSLTESSSASFAAFHEPAFWSNISGWGALESATIFNEWERENLDLPLPPDSVWVKMPDLSWIY